MKKTFIVICLMVSIASTFVCQQAFSETLNVELLYGAQVNVPDDWRDLGSALTLQSNSLMEKKIKEIGLAEMSPELPLISLAAKAGNPPAMITIVLKDCPVGECPDSRYFENMLNNIDEVKLKEKKEQADADKLNAASGHKTIRHFPMEIKRECNAYSMAGGQEVSMYKQIDYVSKVKVIYVENRIFGISIGYPSSDKASGEAAENSFASFGCN